MIIKFVTLCLIFLNINYLSVKGKTNTKTNVIVCGKITNFKEDTVVKINCSSICSKNDNKEIISKIDRQGNFCVRFNIIEPAEYKFYFGHESTFLFLEQGDSLFLELDTKFFDETIIYSGKGADKNNFLAQRYLIENDNNVNRDSTWDIDSIARKRREEKYFKTNSYRLLGVDSFYNKIISFKEEKIKFYNDYFKNKNVSKSFEKYYMGHINFEISYALIFYKHIYNYSTSEYLINKFHSKEDSIKYFNYINEYNVLKKENFISNYFIYFTSSLFLDELNLCIKHQQKDSLKNLIMRIKG